MMEGVAAECSTWSALDSRCLGKTNLLWRPGLEFLGWADPGWLAGERGRVFALVGEMRLMPPGPASLLWGGLP